MTKSTGVGRGGKRAGAGAKTPDNVQGVGSITLTMDADTEAVAYELGEGNYGVGIRRAIKELLQARKTIIELRKNAKGIYTAPAPEPAPPARKSALRIPSTQKEEPPAPTYRTGIPVSNDW